MAFGDKAGSLYLIHFWINRDENVFGLCELWKFSRTQYNLRMCAIAWLSSMWQTKIKDPSQTTMMMILHFITMNALESKHHIASHHIATMQIIQWLPITFDSISKWVQWCKGKNVLCRFYCHTQTHTNPVSPNLCWCHMKSNCFCTEFDRQSPKSIVMPATHTTSVWCLMHGANLPNC